MTGRKLIALLVLLLWFSPVYGESTDPSTTKESTKETQPGRNYVLPPFPFFNESIGAGIGVGAIIEGYYQKQVRAVGAAHVSSNETYIGFLKANNIQFPWVKRIFLEPIVAVSKYG